MGTFLTGHLKGDTKVSDGINLLIRVEFMYSPYRVDTEFLNVKDEFPLSVSLQKNCD